MLRFFLRETTVPLERIIGTSREDANEDLCFGCAGGGDGNGGSPEYGPAGVAERCAGSTSKHGAGSGGAYRSGFHDSAQRSLVRRGGGTGAENWRNFGLPDKSNCACAAQFGCAAYAGAAAGSSTGKAAGGEGIYAGFSACRGGADVGDSRVEERA